MIQRWIKRLLSAIQKIIQAWILDDPTLDKEAPLSNPKDHPSLDIG